MASNNNKAQFADLPVLPLIKVVGEGDENCAFGKAVVKVVGDGNCAFRAIIQALLIQGIVRDKKDEVITFLKRLVIEQEKEVKASYRLDKPADFEACLQQYACLASGKEVDDFFKQYFPSTNKEKEIGSISADSLPPGDAMIYYLSACLRKACISFEPTVPDAQVVGFEKIIDELGTFIEFGSVIPYLKANSIIAELFGTKNNKMGNAVGLEANKNVVYGEGVVDPKFNIKILHTGDHFSTLLAEDDLVNYNEKCQITADEAYACQLAIKEIDKEELRTLSDPLQQEAYARKLQAERYQFFKHQKVKTTNPDNSNNVSQGKTISFNHDI